MARPKKKTGTLQTKKRTLTNDPKKEMVKEAYETLGGAKGTIATGVKPADPDAEIIGRDDSTHVVEKLTHDEEVEKSTYIKILKKWLKPLKSDKRPDEERDLYVLLDKLEKATLEDIKEFFEIDLPVEVRAALQDRYKDISP